MVINSTAFCAMCSAETSNSLISFHGAPEPPKGNDVFDGKISGKGEAEIQSWGFMAGRPDDAIAFLPLRIVVIVVGL